MNAPLAAVASPDFAQAIATYEKAQTALHNAARIAVLDEQLYTNDAIARSDLDQARADSASACRRPRSRDRADGGARGRLDHDRCHPRGTPVPTMPGMIRAPIAGVVVEKLINPGELIQGGQTQCFTIADLSSMWVMANVFESDLDRPSPRGSRAVTTDAWPDTSSDESTTSPPSSTRPRAPPVSASSCRTDTRFSSGTCMSASRSSRSHPHGGLLVPVSSVLRDEENLPFVFVAEPDGGYNRRQVTLGARVGDRYEVISGLKAQRAGRVRRRAVPAVRRESVMEPTVSPAARGRRHRRHCRSRGPLAAVACQPHRRAALGQPLLVGAPRARADRPRHLVASRGCRSMRIRICRRRWSRSSRSGRAGPPRKSSG